MEHDARGEPVERLLEPARPEERVDLEGLSVAGVADGRVVHEHDAPAGPQLRQRRLELQRLVDGGAHERLDRFFAPRLERQLAKAPGKPLGSGEADARHLEDRAVEDRDVGLCEDVRHLAGGVGLEVVIAQHGDLWHLHRLKLLGEDARFVRLAAVGEVATHDEHVRALRDSGEERLKGAQRRLRAVEVADGRDPDGGGHDARSRQLFPRLRAASSSGARSRVSSAVSRGLTRW